MKAVRALMQRCVLAAFPLVLILAIAACGDDPVLPSTVAGEFVANSSTANTVFEVVVGGERIDVLEAGGSIEIALNEDGTTTGRLFAPGMDEGGGDADQDLAGEWSLDDGIVTFELEADTFMDEIEFEASGDRLVADDSITNGTRYHLVLVK